MEWLDTSLIRSRLCAGPRRDHIAAAVRGAGGSKPVAHAPCSHVRGFAPALSPHTPTPAHHAVCRADAATTEARSASNQVLKLNLSTAEAQASLRLAPLPHGKGTAIVVSGLAEGSEAWRAGIRAGHRLIAISDPINLIQVWPLDEMVSARFVREALRMRRSVSIRMDFDISADLLNKQPAIQAQAAPSSRETAAQTGVPGASSTEGATGDRAGDAGAKAESAAVAEENFLDRVTASFDESDGEGSSRTVADAMADAYQQRQQEQAKLDRKKSLVQERIDRREAHMNDVSERNDVPFFSAVAIAFLLVPAAVLTWAISSGYIDTLARGYK